jgi:hypothetical protein
MIEGFPSQQEKGDISSAGHTYCAYATDNIQVNKKTEKNISEDNECNI